MPRFRFLALAAALGVAAPAFPACAQALDDAAIAAPKTGKAAKNKRANAAAPAAPGERKAGELEGWNGGGIPKASGKRLPPGALAEKPRAPDGGLPLPNRDGGDDRAPVGMNSNGGIGGMFRF